MTTLLACLCTIGLFLSGGLATVYPMTGMLMGGVCTTILGTLFAMAVSGNVGTFILELDEGALTVKHLRRIADALEDDTLVYVAGPTILPASSTFTCQLDGRRVLVLERRAESVEPT